jgi:hypothetical protein
MTEKELEIFKSILPREMEVLHYGPGKYGNEGILRWRVGGDVGYLDIRLDSNPIDIQITILTNKAIEYGRSSGAKWASDKLKEILQY